MTCIPFSEMQGEFERVLLNDVSPTPVPSKTLSLKSNGDKMNLTNLS